MCQIAHMNLPESRAKHLFVPLGAVVLLVMVVWWPDQERRQRLRVAPALWPGAEAIVLAHARGELPADEFQMIELPWSSAVMRALGNGAADVVVATLDTVLRMREAGQDLRVVMVLDESQGADVILARPDLRDMKSLKGAKMGVDVRGPGGYVLAAVLEQAGMGFGDVKVVPMIQAEMEQALADKVVDAVACSEPWASRLRDGGRVREVADMPRPEVPVMRVMVASPRACEEFRPQLNALIREQLKGARLLHAGKTFPGMDIVLRREKLEAPTFFAAVRRCAPVDLEANKALLAGESSKIEELASKATALMLRAGLMKAGPAKTSWLDDSLLMEVVE